MSDNTTAPILPTSPEPFEKIRQQAQDRLALCDEFLRKERYRTLLLQASQVAILIAISALALAMNSTGGAVIASVIAVLAALALTISGYLFGYQPQIRWGQYLEARSELNRRILELDILLQGSQAVPPERMRELSRDVSLILERPFGLLERPQENRVVETPTGV